MTYIIQRVGKPADSTGIFYTCNLHTAVSYPRAGVLMHPLPSVV